MALSPLDRAGIGDGDNDRIGPQRGVGRQAEYVTDPGRLAERHDLGPTVVPVSADGDVGIGPVLADMTHQAPDVAGTFGTRRRLAGAQQHRDRTAGRSVVDVDRQKAALAVMAIPKRELLIAVHDIAGIIDVQRHRRRWDRIAGTVDADHRGHHPGQFARGRCILPDPMRNSVRCSARVFSLKNRSGDQHDHCSPPSRNAARRSCRP